MGEKESSEPRKHLDNCLQHEKQLEVSGSGGWGAAGAAGQRFALSVRRDREVSWGTAQEWGGRIL